MKRIALAVLGVMLAVAIIVAIARLSADEKPEPTPPAPSASASTPAADAAPPEGGRDREDMDVEVKELSLGDGSENQRSIRIEHPDPEITRRLRDWLEPRESAAVSGRAAIDCHAELARVSIVSVVCATLPAGEYDAGEIVDAAAAARYESLTLRPVTTTGDVKELAITDLLAADAGQNDVVAACKKAASEASPCEWPPTAFAIGHSGALFMCHESHCVTIDDPSLVRPELR